MVTDQGTAKSGRSPNPTLTPRTGADVQGFKSLHSQSKARDPVCAISVDPATSQHHATHEGQDYHFCSAGCRTKFVDSPDTYLADNPRPQPGAPPITMWTCPMHPQIRRDAPGSCPLCGMALEPEAPSLDDAPNPELVDFTRRWWVSAVLSVPLLILTMGADLFGPHLVSPAISPWLQLALAAPIVPWAGAPFFVRGWNSLRTRHLNMFTLISIGVGAALLYSLVATLAPGLFPPTFQMHGMVPVYYEAAGVVVALVLLGQVLELRARAVTGKAIRALLNLPPKTARRIAADGSETEVPLAEVMTGDRHRCARGRWRAISAFRHTDVPDVRGRGNGIVLAYGCSERVAIEPGSLVKTCE